MAEALELIQLPQSVPDDAVDQGHRLDTEPQNDEVPKPFTRFLCHASDRLEYDYARCR